MVGEISACTQESIKRTPVPVRRPRVRDKEETIQTFQPEEALALAENLPTREAVGQIWELRVQLEKGLKAGSNRTTL